MKKTFRKTALAGLTSLALVIDGCNSGKDIMQREAIMGNYKILFSIDGLGRHLVIKEGSDSTNTPFLFAKDHGKDGRFDEINLHYVPRGNPLEAYANIDSLETIWNRVIKEGK